MGHKKINLYFRALLLMPTLALVAMTSCNTDVEIIKTNANKPWQQNPELWAAYTSALCDYKMRDHFVCYASFDNAPKVATSEENFMRSLPDSLDIVSLTNADNISIYDIEDIAIMHQKGTRILYGIDYAARTDEFSNAAKLGAYLDRVVAAVAANHLDGYSFTGIPNVNNEATVAAAQIVAKLSTDDSKLLVFEGNPLFVAATDRAKIDYFVLDTYDAHDIFEVKLQVSNALDFATVPTKKLILSAKMGFPINDEGREEHAAISEITRRVISLGPLGGVAVYNVAEDYYHSDMNYSLLRMSIQTLNPSK